MGEKYILYKTYNKIVDWKAYWFYVENHALALPDRVPGPQYHNEWHFGGENAEQAEELLGRIENLKQSGVTGGSVVLTRIGHHIQPLQNRCNLGFDYIGVSDPSHFSLEKIHQHEAMKRV